MSGSIDKPVDERSGVGRRLRRAFRYSLATWLWMSLLAAILLLWYRDHQQLARRIATHESPDRTGWSIDQIIGPPDTVGYGDIPSAWASRSPDAQDEFVIVEFPQAVQATAVEIHETYNAGAVVRIWSVSMDSSTELLWSGTDPLLGTAAGGVSRIQLTTPKKTRRLRIDIDSQARVGWNEIDAVALIDHQGGRQWVRQAWASSSFGQNRQPPKWFWP